MPYTLPTVSDFRDRFPEFDSKADTQVEAAITDASRRVDNTWIEGDYQTAILYLAAHLIAVADAAASGGGVIQSERIGPISVTYAVDASTKPGQLASTSYGQYWAELNRLNNPPIEVI